MAPCSGKSSISKVLAEKFSWRALDLDSEIEKRSGRSIDEIISVDGEDSFRALESEALKLVLEEEFDVLSLGGGVLLGEKNRKALSSNASLVLLDVSLDNLVRRSIFDESFANSLEGGGIL